MIVFDSVKCDCLSLVTVCHWSGLLFSDGANKEDLGQAGMWRCRQLVGACLHLGSATDDGGPSLYTPGPPFRAYDLNLNHSRSSRICLGLSRVILNAMGLGLRHSENGKMWMH